MRQEISHQIKSLQADTEFMNLLKFTLSYALKTALALAGIVIIVSAFFVGIYAIVSLVMLRMMPQLLYNLILQIITNIIPF